MPAAPGLTPLQRRAAREIIALVRREDRPAGHHLSKLALARVVGTSHNPVEGALAHLARIGVARHEKDRGYFLARDARLLGSDARKLSPADDDPLYRRILDLRLGRRLPDTLSETALIRKLGAARAPVRRALARIQQEGWIERRAGNGWAFLPLIDSVEAYEDNYEMRRIVEPAGLLSPKFAPVPEEFETLRRQQHRMANGGYRTMTAVEWVDINATFHETLARWSGNRLMHQTIRHINRLRKLLEHRVVAGDPGLRARQAAEHLEILDAIGRGDRKKAAALMEKHLVRARRDKARPDHFTAGRR